MKNLVLAVCLPFVTACSLSIGGSKAAPTTVPTTTTTTTTVVTTTTESPQASGWSPELRGMFLEQFREANIQNAECYVDWIIENFSVSDVFTATDAARTAAVRRAINESGCLVIGGGAS